MQGDKYNQSQAEGGFDLSAKPIRKRKQAMAVNPRCAKCHWQHTPGQSIDYCIMCMREREHEPGFVGMTEHEAKFARSPALVEVNQDQYNAYLDTIKHLELFSEGHDVGRTHGIGAIYLGSRLVAQWRWVFDDDRKRVWTYEILSTEVPHVPLQIEDRYFVIDLKELSKTQADALRTFSDNQAVYAKEGIFLGVNNPVYAKAKALLEASINRNKAEGQ
jgi:hypothetical protein